MPVSVWYIWFTSETSFYRVNWHEAAACAVQIELRDYEHMLDFQTEYMLGHNSYRIDLLVIRKLSDLPIFKNIAHNFKAYNLFEVKGFHSSLSVSSYYKTIGYAGILIDQISCSRQYSSLDVTLSFLAFRYPRKLMKHLREERHLTVANPSPGVYDISNETFITQIIVTRELPPEENLYLRCLTGDLQDTALVRRLADDYTIHKEQDIYTRYLHQLATANIKTKGERPMVCEGLFNLFGTSSEEIIARAKRESKMESDQFYLPKINELSSQVDYLKNLLKQNNIPFDLELIPGDSNAPLWSHPFRSATWEEIKTPTKENAYIADTASKVFLLTNKNAIFYRLMRQKKNLFYNFHRKNWTLIHHFDFHLTPSDQFAPHFFGLKAHTVPRWFCSHLFK